VAGRSAITAQTILCEIGSDVTRFRNAPAFASWLGLCPENKISGGKVLYTKRRRVRTREAYTRVSFTAAIKKLYNAHNFGSADKPLNSGFKSSPYRMGDVPWESASGSLS
jgi:transposase